MRYFDRIRKRAGELGSDGCTWVPDCYLIVCQRHDVHYRTHRTMTGKPITQAMADQHLRSGVRHLSVMGMWSPMAMWRFWALRKLGKKAWRQYAA